jgi:hypothetical protein
MVSFDADEASCQRHACPVQVFDQARAPGSKSSSLIRRKKRRTARACGLSISPLPRQPKFLLELLVHVARGKAQKSGVFFAGQRNSQLGEVAKKGVVVQRLGVNEYAVHVEDDGANHAEAEKALLKQLKVDATTSTSISSNPSTSVKQYRLTIQLSMMRIHCTQLQCR